MRNERLKLAAGALNTLGVAIIVSAIVVPLIGSSYGTMKVLGLWYVWGGAWLLAGLTLHGFAQAILGRLR